MERAQALILLMLNPSVVEVTQVQRLVTQIGDQLLGLGCREDDIDDRDALLDQFQPFTVTTILQCGHRQLDGFGILLGLATVAGSQGFAVLLAVIPEGNVKDG